MYEDHPYGSARLEDDEAVLRAFRDLSGIPFGYVGRHALTHSSNAGALLISGAGAQKFTTVLSHVLAAQGRGSRRASLPFLKGKKRPVRMAIIDPKGEMAAVIGPGLIHRGAKVFTVNPFNLHGLPNHRVNLWAHLLPQSPTLVADCRSAAEQILPVLIKDGNRFWEKKAQNWVEALIRGLVYLDGEVSHLRLYELINLIRANHEAWAQLSEVMASRGSPDLASEYAEMLKAERDNERVYHSVLGEISNVIAYYGDPRLQDTFVGSSAADFSCDVLTEDDGGDVYVFFIMPVELMAQYAFLARQFFSTVRVLKQRSLGSPVIDLVADEADLLGEYEDAGTLYSSGRGAGLSPFFVYQSYAQMVSRLGQSGAATLQASSDLEIYLGGGVSDLSLAEQLSRRLGQQTLEVADELVRERAARARSEIMNGVLFDGDDPLRAGLALHALAQEENHTRKLARSVLTADEIIGLSRDKALILPSGYGIRPFLAHKVPYYRVPGYAGRYFPNPYFDADPNKVLVRGRTGTRYRRVIREKVPSEFAEFPQYQGGEWSFIEGYRPKLK